MNNNILEQNLKHISAYNKDLAQKIACLSDLQSNYEIKEAKSGDSILYKDSVSLDDENDPVWSSLEKYNKVQNKSIKSISVIYGMGLGYLFKEFAKRHAGKIIVYEPNIEILRIVFEIVDFSEELKKHNIRITSSIEEVKKEYLGQFFLDYGLNLTAVKYYEQQDPLTIKDFKENIEKVHGMYQSNYSNLFKKGPKWALSLFNNIPHILKNKDVYSLKDKFKGKTAVIMSAGPSLDKNIEDLKPFKDKVVIFCVGTAFKTAVKHGVMPDFTVAIEQTASTEKQLDLPEISQTNLIAATQIFQKVYELKPKSFLNYHNNKEATATWLGTLINAPMEEYESAGTVSITALYSAKMMGIDKVIYIGQDLAYTDNKCYSKDSLYGSYKIDESKTVNPVDTEKLKKELDSNDKLISKHAENLGKNMHYIKSYDGGKVLSRSDLILFIVYFEEIAAKLGSEIKLINATEGGAYINGFEHITLKEALEKYTNDLINKEQISEQAKLSNKELKKRKKVISLALKDIIKNYYQIRETIKTTIDKTIKPHFSDEITGMVKILTNLYPEVFKSTADCLSESSANSEIPDAIYKYIETRKQYLELFDKETQNLLQTQPKTFSNNLKTMKDNFISIKNNLYNNVFFKNLMIKELLTIDNQIKDFENNDKNLINLYKDLGQYIFLSMSIQSTTIIKYLEEIIKELEK